MTALTNLACLLLTLFLFAGGLSPARGANFPGTIQYKQTMVQVADASKSPYKDWGGTDPRYFREIVVSADGTKVGFVVKLNLYSDKHIYVMNADGSSPVDLTGNLPGAMTANDIANLQINDTGSRLFFRAYSLGNIYYFDTASHASATAFLDADWVDTRKA